MCLSTPVEFLTLILFKMNRPLLAFLKGNIRDFGLKISVIEFELLNLTYLKKVCSVVKHMFAVKNRIRDIYTLLA